MAYRNPSIASAAIIEARRDLEERGCVNIVLHSGSEHVHLSAFNPKKKRRVDIHVQPYEPLEKNK